MLGGEQTGGGGDGDGLGSRKTIMEATAVVQMCAFSGWTRKPVRVGEMVVSWICFLSRVG